MTYVKSLSSVSLPKIDRSWILVDIAGTASAEECLTIDEQLFDQVARGEAGPCIRIWRNRQCLVATIKESKMPNFDQASQALEKQGWPVLLRRTGGSCVPHGSGVINISMIYPIPEGQTWELDNSYELLCFPLQKLLQEYGLKAETGFVDGSFCDGKYNLQVNDRKLVGTAQRWRRRATKQHTEESGQAATGAILAHACLLTDLDLLTATESINQLYRDCGQGQQFSLNSCATLAECVGRDLNSFSEEFVCEVVHRLTQIVKTMFKV